MRTETIIVAQVDAKTVFPNYQAQAQFLSEPIWNGLRVATLVVWIAVAVLLIVDPDDGLKLLWGFIVPIVPAIVVVAPGVWRQICPMAFANQTPGRLGLSRGRDLPERVKDAAFFIAVAIFVVVVALRHPLFNHVGPATGALLLFSLAAAFAGGLIFKRRSGWCGTFCPLGPIQRTYGQAPLLAVPQTYCATCVGCQKNCYDFNPVASAFDDIHDDDPRYAGQRRFFMAMILGFVLGYFVQGSEPAYGYPIYLAILLASALGTVGIYQFSVSYLRLDPYRCALGFAAAALVAFYWFAGPIILRTVESALHVSLPGWAFWASRSIGALTAASLFLAGLRNRAIYEVARKAAEADAARKAAEGASGLHKVIEGDKTYFGRDGQTLLEVMKGGRANVVANCLAGLCGSDAVIVEAGAEALSPPSDDEKATIQRLGLTGSARLACSARVYGPVTISRAAVGAPAPARPAARAATAAAAVVPADRLDLARRAHRASKPMAIDRGARAGLERVVIIGNGVAGVTVADELRKASHSVEITLVSVERHHFYNRMALNKIIDGKSRPADLLLQSPSWCAEHRIDAALDIRVEAIDRATSRVLLEGGRSLPYDRLVIATGARPRAPFPSFLARRNCFVLRSMADAEQIRDHVREAAPRSCVVLGAGVLGVEAAETLRHIGLDVTLIARGRRLMDRNLDEESATLLHRYLARIGVRTMLETKIGGYDGEDALRAIRLADGNEVAADMFVACLGQQPNLELARDCGLATERGVIVNPLMMTTDSNIYAVGDVAELPGTGEGLWPIAIAQARTAVASMLGAGERYVEPRVVMRLKSDGVELRSFGALKAQPGDETMLSPPFTGDWWRVIIREGRIIGAVFAGPSGRKSPLWDLVLSNADVTPHRFALEQGQLDAIRIAAGDLA